MQDRALTEIKVANVTNIKGFSITVSESEIYKFANGLIISRQGINAFMLNTNGSGVPAVTIEHIMGSDTITPTVSGQEVKFEASTTWNNFGLLFSTTFVANGYIVSPIRTN